MTETTITPTGPAELDFDSNLSLADLAAKMSLPLPDQQQPDGQPLFPAASYITDALRDGLSRLPDVFGQVVPRGAPRKLSAQELDRLTEEAQLLHDILESLGARHEGIKETIRIHLDAVAPPDAAVDSKGHAILAAPQDPFRVPVRSRGVAWSHEYRSGTLNFASTEELLRLFENGDLNREEYLAMTREVRVLDQDKARIFFRKHPARGTAILRLISRRGAPHTALALRKLKKGE